MRRCQECMSASLYGADQLTVAECSRRKSDLRGGFRCVGDATNYISEARRDKGAGPKITCYTGRGYPAEMAVTGSLHVPDWLPVIRDEWSGKWPHGCPNPA